MNEISVFPGKPLPHGASLIKDGVNFSVFSRNAEKIWIDIFNNPNDAHPVHSFALDADQHRTGDVWHIFLKGLGAGT
ncbi:MAG TPA: glycogen debranching enzyme, partial [Treponemataceae bacterium]|nr:glycogen debranching enzyme [Treponemataceae bacterium]